MKIALAISFFMTLHMASEVSAQWIIKHLDESFTTYNSTIKFKNDSLGLFMGSNSKVLKSTDVGETWTTLELNIQININDFQFLHDSIIYAIGEWHSGPLTSKLIKSSDNGNTWDSIAIFKGKQLYDIWFFNNDSGLLAGYDGIYRTIDTGNSWDTVWSITQFGYKYGALEQIYFPTNQIGYAIGRARTQNSAKNLFDFFLLKTYNSGIHWDTIKAFPFVLKTVYFVNQDTGYIGTEQNIVLKTMDGGITWNETYITDNSINSINSIHFNSDITGFIAGAPFAFIPEGSTSFYVAKTNDGGNSWESYDTIGIPLNSIYFLNDTVGFVSGVYCLIMKTNSTISGLPPDYPWFLVPQTYIKDIDVTNSGIKAFPIPTSGSLTIKLTDEANSAEIIKIINSSGQLVKILEPKSNFGLIRLDLSELASGIYIIQVYSSNNIEVLKIYKE